MSFGQSIRHVLGNLANFNGRARRSEFWWFYLFVTLIGIPIGILTSVPLIIWAASVDTTPNGSLTQDQVNGLVGASVATVGLSLVFGVVMFFLTLAVWVRRLHDAGYSGHWLWFTLVGLSIVPLILAILDGQRGPNRWGEDPKGGGWPHAAPSAPPAAPSVPPPGATGHYVAPLNPGPDLAPPVPDDTTDPFAAPPR